MTGLLMAGPATHNHSLCDTDMIQSTRKRPFGALYAAPEGLREQKSIVLLLSLQLLNV